MMSTWWLSMQVSLVGVLLVLTSSASAQNTFPATGNVGIGTMAPVVPLDVAGRIRMTNGSDFSEMFTGTSGGVTGLHFGSRTNMPMAFYTNSSGPRVILDVNGNLGIGTVPLARFHVYGDAQFDGNVQVSGNIAAKYQDVAEWVPTRQPIVAGTLVTIDPRAINTVVPVDHAYDTRVVGVVTDQPGVILGEGGANKAKVAQSGRVKVKVDAQYGAVAPGDLLVSSPTPGYAMRSVPITLGETSIHRPGTLIGKALEPLEAGQDEILVFLTLH
jgi:hypothetical protein